MNETSILQYCYFYKGEEICPKQYDGKNEGKLWQAEKFICEELFGFVDNSTPPNKYGTTRFRLCAKMVAI